MSDKTNWDEFAEDSTPSWEEFSSPEKQSFQDMIPEEKSTIQSIKDFFTPAEGDEKLGVTDNLKNIWETGSPYSGKKNPLDFLNKSASEIESGKNAALKGATKSGYFGMDDTIVGAIAGEEEKDRYKADQDRAQQENPASFLTGELGTGMAIPTGGASLLKNVPWLAKVAQKSPILAKMMSEAAAGGLQGATAGVGYSEEEDPTMSGALGAGIGMGFPAVGALGGKIASKLPKGSTIFKGATGLSDLEYDVARNKDLSTAKSPEQMESFYQNILDSLKGNVSKADDKVKSSMTKFDQLADVPGVGRPLEGISAFGGVTPDAVTPPQGTLSRGDLSTALQDLIKGGDGFDALADFRPKTGKFEFKNAETEKVFKGLQRQVNQSLKGMEEFIPEDRVMGMVDELTSSINYDKDSNLKQKITKGLASRIKEQVYSRNPALKEAKGLSQDALELDELGRRILAPSTEWQGSQKLSLPSDTTRRAEARLLNPESFETKRFSDRLKQATGLDLEDETLKRSVKESTRGGAPTGFWDREGAKKAAELAGLGTVGYAVGSSYGEGTSAGGVGIGLGLLRQKYGKRLGTAILQKLQRVSNNKMQSLSRPEAMKLAEDYARGGNKKLAATYYVMSQRNKDLREEKED
jgi:hypothetical protein